MRTCACNDRSPCIAHDPREECEECEFECAHCGSELDKPCERHSNPVTLMEDAAEMRAAEDEE